MDSNIDILKELLETGVITQEEFDAKVNQLSEQEENIEEQKSSPMKGIDYDELKNLEELRNDGVLDEEEYSKKVAQICGLSISTASSEVIASKGTAVDWLKKNIIATVVIVALAAALAFVGARYASMQGEINQLNETIAQKDSTIKDVTNEKIRLSKEVSEYEDSYAFYKEYVAICPVDDKYYHNYNCSKLTGDFSFWIYNHKDAEQHGYSKCPNCY